MKADATHASPTPVEAASILRYFLRHPRAADSLEGVARWRLLEERIERSVHATRHALDWLVDRGFLRRLTAAGVGPLFVLDADRRGEAERFLAAGPATPGQQT